MSASPECHVIVHPPLPGAVNMAIDELLLNRGLSGTASLRFYQWAEPTVSLGHFQTRQFVAVPDRFQGCPVVRRLSGGGAILHDQELTYSCVLPVSHPLHSEPSRLYDLVHESVIDVLARLGVSCRFRGEDAFADQSFLCFSRGDARDLVICQNKILGSAQRRRQGVVLQHGSLLLRHSPWAREFPGIEDLAGISLSPTELIPELTKEVTQRLDYLPVPTELPIADLDKQLPEIDSFIRFENSGET